MDTVFGRNVFCGRSVKRIGIKPVIKYNKQFSGNPSFIGFSCRGFSYLITRLILGKHIITREISKGRSTWITQPQ